MRIAMGALQLTVRVWDCSGGASSVYDMYDTVRTQARTAGADRAKDPTRGKAPIIPVRSQGMKFPSPAAFRAHSGQRPTFTSLPAFSRR